jgi:hypothetical protein
MIMRELNEDWGSPWRTLQALLASQFGVVRAGELTQPASNDDGAVNAPSWINRARQRRLINDPTRQ